MIHAQDYYGALEVLHPDLHAFIVKDLKKLQRKVETFELKQSVSKPAENSTMDAASSKDEQVQQLNMKLKNMERVNKELKKQITCYKEEITQFKETDSTY